MRKNSVKNNRINDAVMRELSEVIRAELKDPRIAPMTTVTAAEVAPDLKTCKVYVSVLGDADKKSETLAGLNSSRGYMRRLLAQNLNLRHTPELIFRLDESIEYGNHMSKLISDVISRDETVQNAREEAEMSSDQSEAYQDGSDLNEVD